jgi:hypothetical protein
MYIYTLYIHNFFFFCMLNFIKWYLGDNCIVFENFTASIGRFDGHKLLQTYFSLELIKIAAYTKQKNV